MKFSWEFIFTIIIVSRKRTVNSKKKKTNAAHTKVTEQIMNMSKWKKINILYIVCMYVCPLLAFVISDSTKTHFTCTVFSNGTVHPARFGTVHVVRRTLGSQTWFFHMLQFIRHHSVPLEKLYLQLWGNRVSGLKGAGGEPTFY